MLPGLQLTEHNIIFAGDEIALNESAQLLQISRPGVAQARSDDLRGELATHHQKTHGFGDLVYGKRGCSHETKERQMSLSCFDFVSFDADRQRPLNRIDADHEGAVSVA
jgi:hypothetical protein